MRPKISAVVITKNEETNINNCLQIIKWADEIVLVDDFSSDNTVKIAQKYTKKIFQRKFDWPPNQKQFGVNQAKNDWIFVVDADERISPKLKKEIIEKIKSDNYVAYHCYFRNVFLGKILKGSNAKIEGTQRLFRKSKAKFLLNTSHEKLIINGQVGILENEILHLTINSISQSLEKINSRSSREALELYSYGGRTSLSKMFLATIRIFIKRFLIEKNYRDGIHGFIFSLLLANFYLYKHIKIWELGLKEKKQKP